MDEARGNAAFMALRCCFGPTVDQDIVLPIFEIFPNICLFLMFRPTRHAYP